MTAAGIHFDRQGCLGIAVLDRPQALNALTHDMVLAFGRQLALWAADPAVAAVVVRAVPGRAFCAGGDVRAVVRLHAEKGLAEARRFFWDEYRMNWRIKRLPKPYIALLDGVTMGGGVGLSIHGSHRVVTERMLFAMPETAIGMFPDVGCTYALSHLPKGSLAMGLYLGCTGARLGSGDCMALGIGTHLIDSAALPALIDELARSNDVARTLDGLVAGAVGPSDNCPTAARAAMIEDCFKDRDLGIIMGKLASQSGEWARTQLETLQSVSPFALRLTAAAIDWAAARSFEPCLCREYRLVQTVLAHGDFAEGVRALLIDKDKRPRWRESGLETVDDQLINPSSISYEYGYETLLLDWDEKS